MKTKAVVAVFGYNNTRIYDVLKLKKIVQERHGADLLLIKEAITDADRQVTPYCFDHRPEDPGIVPGLKSFLTENSLNLIGCLPFSDKGVIGASHASQAMGLTGDEAVTSLAMLDKNLFRKLEANIPVSERNYKKPFFTTVHEEKEIRDFFQKSGPFFIKPTSEGNSRGCMKIESLSDVDQWLKDNASALKQGVICEELLANDNEYSFDGVAGHYWITQKFTTSGAFRAEYQHIVPAPLDRKTTASVHETLRPLLDQLGSRGGAFHHEFFMLQDGRVASVEPNRRPAGMWIWDLASWSFPEFNPWNCWVDHCVGATIPSQNMNREFFSGVRGVISNLDGMIESVDQEQIAAELHALFGPDSVRFSILKSPGGKVTGTPKDNSDFLAFVALKNPDYDQLIRDLKTANKIILSNMKVKPCALN